MSATVMDNSKQYAAHSSSTVTRTENKPDEYENPDPKFLDSWLWKVYFILCRIQLGMQHRHVIPGVIQRAWTEHLFTGGKRNKDDYRGPRHSLGLWSAYGTSRWKRQFYFPVWSSQARSSLETDIWEPSASRQKYEVNYKSEHSCP